MAILYALFLVSLVTSKSIPNHVELQEKNKSSEITILTGTNASVQQHQAEKRFILLPNPSNTIPPFTADVDNAKTELLQKSIRAKRNSNGRWKEVCKVGKKVARVCYWVWEFFDKISSFLD
jgi:hypothetical protein